MNKLSIINDGTVDVYESIYQPHYDLSTHSLALSEKTIAGHMDWIGIDKEWLASATVFNIGTGREAYTYKKFGARQIIHADLSLQAIDALKQKAVSEGWADALISLQGDVCAGLPELNQKADLIYLNGVLHHIHTPEKALESLSKLTTEDSYFFICIYRTGSFLFFLATWLRKLVSAEEKPYFLDNQNALMNSYTFDFTDLIDDLFVPVLNLFDLNQLIAAFSASGFDLVQSDAHVDYDHSARYSPFYRMLFRRNHKSAGHVPQVGTIDQFTGIDYKSDDIRATLRIFEAAEPIIQALPLEQRAKYIISAYAIESDPNLDVFNRHAQLQALTHKYLAGGNND